jgi:hypothetical protein
VFVQVVGAVRHVGKDGHAQKKSSVQTAKYFTVHAVAGVLDVPSNGTLKLDRAAAGIRPTQKHARGSNDLARSESQVIKLGGNSGRKASTIQAAISGKERQRAARSDTKRFFRRKATVSKRLLDHRSPSANGEFCQEGQCSARNMEPGKGYIQGCFCEQ